MLGISWNSAATPLIDVRGLGAYNHIAADFRPLQSHNSKSLVIVDRRHTETKFTLETNTASVTYCYFFPVFQEITKRVD